MMKTAYRIFARLSRFIPHETEEAIKEYFFKKSILPSDVFIVAHPKSGNTWLAFALAILLNKDHQGKIHMPDLKNYIPTIHANDARIAYFPNLVRPRTFRNEWPQYPNLYRNTIYIIRDPRSVLVSYYHHYQVIYPEKKATLKEFVQEYLKNGNVRDFEPELVEWNVQVAEWLEREKRQSVLIVKFEDMRKNLAGVLKEVGRFMRNMFPDEDIELAVRRTDFTAMQQDEAKHGAEAYPKETADRGRFIRDDDWEHYMDRETASLIEEKYAALMKRLGYL